MTWNGAWLTMKELLEEERWGLSEFILVKDLL